MLLHCIYFVTTQIQMVRPKNVYAGRISKSFICNCERKKGAKGRYVTWKSSSQPLHQILSTVRKANSSSEVGASNTTAVREAVDLLPEERENFEYDLDFGEGETNQVPADADQQTESKVLFNELLPLMISAYCERFWPSSDTDNQCLCLDCGKEIDENCHTGEWHLKSSPAVGSKASHPAVYSVKSDFKDEIILQLPQQHFPCSANHDFRAIKIFDFKGRFRKASVQICTDDHPQYPLAVSLIRHNLWPCSPTEPKRAVHFSVMELIYSFVVQTKTSLYRCAQAFSFFASFTSDRNTEELSFYRSISRNYSFRFFRMFVHRIHYARDLTPAVENVSCAACPKEGGQISVNLDACFQLVSRTKVSRDPTDFELKEWGQFLSDTTKLKDLMNRPSAAAEKDSEDCSQFTAGDILKSQMKNRGLRVKGVFGATCSHQFPLIFADMAYGERYCYGIHILKELVEKKKIPPGATVSVFYDISCKFVAHLERMNEKDLLEFNYYVGVFHSYAHSLYCQLKYNARICGATLFDGEALERIWAMLEAAAKCMKEMDSSNRSSLLNDFLYSYGFERNSKIGDWLIKRHREAEEIGAKAEKELMCSMEILLQETAINCIDDLGEELTAMRERFKKNSKRLPPENWKMTYIMDVDRYDSLQKKNQMGRTSVSEKQELSRLDSSLSKHERDHGMARRWQPTDAVYQNVKNQMLLEKLKPVVQALSNAVVERNEFRLRLRKYVPGQLAFNKIHKLMVAKGNEVKKQVAVYNSLEKPTYRQIPETLYVSSIQDLNHKDWVELQNVKENIELHPWDTVKIAAIRQKGLIESAANEKILLERSMQNVTNYYFHRYQGFLGCVKENTGDTVLPLYIYHMFVSHEKFKALNDKFKLCLENGSAVLGDPGLYDCSDIVEQVLLCESDDE